MRPVLCGSLVAFIMMVGVGPPVAAQSPSPVPSPLIAIDAGIAVPSATAVGEALGIEVEDGGTRADIGQLWEGAELEPGVVTDALMQSYRWAPSDGEDAAALAVVEIVRFRSIDEAVVHGGAVAEAISGPLASFAPDLPAELVAAGSFTSEEGAGGSAILVREGPVVAIVTVLQTGAKEMERASTALAALVLEGIRSGG